MTKEATVKKAKTGAVIEYSVIRDKYTTHEAKTGSGKRRAVDNNDKVASALRGTTEKDWAKIAKENGIKLNKELQAGLRRLALGNSLRRVLRVEKKINVLGKTVKA
jgi:hypothetical protein